MTYIQAPRLTELEIEALLGDVNLARFCSLNPDGTIHAVPVNFRYKNGRLLIATPSASRKAKNAKRDGNVTVLVDATGPQASDFKGAIIYGTLGCGSSHRCPTV